MRAWIETHVEIAGPIEQPHLRPWATALRVPTTTGTVWFKASREAFAFEAALLEILVPLAPDLLPEVIASRPERGWLLLADAGARAREEPIEWAPLLRRYAELQLEATSETDRLLAAGVPDRRSIAAEIVALLPALRAETAAALASRVGEIEAADAELHGIARTIEHGDLHDGNVFATARHVRILDWGDASVAHPFLSLAVEIDPGARDAYLEPFTAVATRAEIERAVAAVLKLRTLIRAVNDQRVAPYDAGWSRYVEDGVAAFLAGP